MRFLINIIIFCLIFYSSAFSMTGPEALEKLQERFFGAETVKGKVSLTFQSGESYSGSFVYEQSGKIIIRLVEPPGKIIVTNGKKLWVYDITTDVCGVQEIDIKDKDEKKDNKDKTAAGEETDEAVRLTGGIGRFIKTYEVISFSENAPGYVITLYNEKRKYSEIELSIDAEFMLTKAVFKDKNGEGYAVKLSDIKTGESILPGAFNFDVPANAQVVKNPLDVR